MLEPVCCSLAQSGRLRRGFPLGDSVMDIQRLCLAPFGARLLKYSFGLCVVIDSAVLVIRETYVVCSSRMRLSKDSTWVFAATFSWGVHAFLSLENNKVYVLF